MDGSCIGRGARLPHGVVDLVLGRPADGLALNMFCQYIYLWMHVIPAADFYNQLLRTAACWRSSSPTDRWTSPNSAGTAAVRG